MAEKRDHGNYNFDWDKDEYIDAGFTETDFELMSRWIWNDTEYFTLERLQLMREIGQNHRYDNIRFEKALIKYNINDIADISKSSVLPTAFLFVFVLSLLIRKKECFLCAILCAGMIFLEYYYMECTKRLEYRIEFGIWASAIFFSLMNVMSSLKNGTDNSAPIRILQKRIFTVSSITLSLAILITTYFGLINQFREMKNGHIIQTDDSTYYTIEAARQNPDNFYFGSIDVMFAGMCGAKNIFDIDCSYRNFFFNISPIGGWIIPSPIGLEAAEKAGMDNPFRALFERENVYYVGGGEGMGYILVFSSGEIQSCNYHRICRRTKRSTGMEISYPLISKYYRHSMYMKQPCC